MDSDSKTKEPLPDTPLQTGWLLGDRFTLVEQVEGEQIEIGAPAVWKADGPYGSFVAKVWSNPSNEDLAVRAIWNQEVKTLLKLNSIPRARAHFATLEALGSDPGRYFAIIDGGGRELLSAIMKVAPSPPWLRNRSNQNARARIWAGLEQLATGLQMLHDQGTLHRALRPDCVFVDPNGDCDFRLSGFEWSLRLNVASEATYVDHGVTRLRAPELDAAQPAYSIASDWFDFGLLAAELVLGVKPVGRGLEALNAFKMQIRAVTRGFSDIERELIIGLLTSNPDERRSFCSGVPERFGAVAKRLGAGEGSFERPLRLAVQLSAAGELARAIYRVSENRILPDDAEAQLAWIRDDLKSNPTVTSRSRPRQHMVVHGASLSYRVERFDHGGRPTWLAGYCTGLDKGGSGSGKRQRLYGREIRIEAPRFVRAALNDPNGRQSAWDEVAPFEAADETGEGAEVRDFLLLTNHLDALITMIGIWPVRVSEQRPEGSGDWIDVVAVDEPDRDAVAKAMGFDVPSRQMERAFVDQIGEIGGQTEFHIVMTPKLTRVPRETGIWTFDSERLTSDGRQYRFRRTGGLHSQFEADTVYIRPVGINASMILLERRFEAIQALKDQPSMLLALDDPGAVSRDTMDSLPEDRGIEKLDGLKRKALSEIWRRQPLYLLQGPPGTGKTALVQAMIHRALQSDIDPSLQFLATAQANDTVEQLAGKLMKGFAKVSPEDARAARGPESPMLVRLDNDKSHFSPARVAEPLVARLITSPLGQSAPKHIAARLASLQSTSGQAARREKMDMERLVSRAANVVLATTTSGDLEEMLKDGKRFDWCIVEEAAKIHGFDLAMPMLASHRMLMIGDHQQLPAFNERIYLELFQRPERLKVALLSGALLVARKLAYQTPPLQTENEFDEFSDKCTRWRSMVRIFGRAFTASYRPGDGGSKLAERLVEQHRMHPDICDLVKTCFYPDLIVAESSRERLTGPDPFELAPNAWIPKQRIVFVDVPYVQASRNARGQDVNEQGKFVLSSRHEAEVVTQVLSQFVPTAKCEIQILTPYNLQVGRIRSALRQSTQAGRLPHLGNFSVASEDGELGSTIDGFQGGEADIIVISLVRNNSSSPRGGVGILADSNRLNVMLSRASRKMVIVGSWDFFKKRATHEALVDPSDELHALAKVFNALEEAECKGSAKLYRGPRPWGHV